MFLHLIVVVYLLIYLSVYIYLYINIVCIKTFVFTDFLRFFFFFFFAALTLGVPSQCIPSCPLCFGYCPSCVHHAFMGFFHFPSFVHCTFVIGFQRVELPLICLYIIYIYVSSMFSGFSCIVHLYSFSFMCSIVSFMFLTLLPSPIQCFLFDFFACLLLSFFLHSCVG